MYKYYILIVLESIKIYTWRAYLALLTWDSLPIISISVDPDSFSGKFILTLYSFSILLML